VVPISPRGFTGAQVFRPLLWFEIFCWVVLPAMAGSLGYWIRLEVLEARIRERAQARIAERERIARELHDTLLQGVQALLFRLSVWTNDSTIAAARRAEIATVESDVRSMIIEGRERILALRGFDSGHEDLPAALESIGQLESEGRPASVSVAVTGQQRPLNPDVSSQLFYIAQEGIRNAQRHAHAQHVRVLIEYRKSTLSITVADDGRGFDASAFNHTGRPSQLGLLGMSERAAALGAGFAIESSELIGTRVVVSVPAHSAFADIRHAWAPGLRKSTRAAAPAR
jgi:signal transduction histidine kinase